MAPLDPHELGRRRDAAFFEDWTEWDSLDDLPRPDRQFGHFRQSPEDHNRYWCMLRKHSDRMGGPCFEMSLPQDATVERLIDGIPGVRRMPGRFHGSAGHLLVPAEHWRQLRERLPIIKAAVKKWVAAPR